MPDISPAMIAEGLKRFGYAPTPENVQRAGEMLASNPGMLDKLMGLQGGAGGESGANPSVMMSQLDKLAGSKPDVAVSVGNGNPNQPPLPQAPLPENMLDANSPTSVATTSATAPVVAPQAAIPPTLSNSAPTSTGMPSNAADTALNKIVSDTSAAPSTPVSPITTPTTSNQFTYTVDPTKQIPDEFIAAGGSLAAGAALYAKAKADWQARSGTTTQMSPGDITLPAAGPRATELGDIDASTANRKRIEAELDADPSRKGLKQYSEPVDPNALQPKGRVEPQGDATKGRKAMIDVLKRASRAR